MYKFSNNSSFKGGNDLEVLLGAAFRKIQICVSSVP